MVVFRQGYLLHISLSGQGSWRPEPNPGGSLQGLTAWSLCSAFPLPCFTAHMHIGSFQGVADPPCLPHCFPVSLTMPQRWARTESGDPESVPTLQQTQRADPQRLIQEWSGKSQTFFSSFRVHRNKTTVHCFRLENWVLLRSHSFPAPVSSPLLLSNTQTKSKLGRKGVILSYTSRSHSLPLREVKAGT